MALVNGGFLHYTDMKKYLKHLLCRNRWSDFEIISQESGFDISGHCLIQAVIARGKLLSPFVSLEGKVKIFGLLSSIWVFIADTSSFWSLRSISKLLCTYPVIPSFVHVCIYFEWFPLWLFLELDSLLWNIVLEVSGPFYNLNTRYYATNFNMNFLEVPLLL